MRFGLVSVVWSLATYQLWVSRLSFNTQWFPILWSHFSSFALPHIFFPSSEMEKDREKERGKETSLGEASLSASINGTDFSRPSIWQVQTGCEPGAAPHLSVCIPSPLFVNKQINAAVFCMLGFMNNLFTKLMCVCGCVCASERWPKEACERRGEADKRVNWIVGKMQILHCLFELGGGVSADCDRLCSHTPMHAQTHTLS